MKNVLHMAAMTIMVIGGPVTLLVIGLMAIAGYVAKEEMEKNR